MIVTRMTRGARLGLVAGVVLALAVAGVVIGLRHGSGQVAQAESSSGPVVSGVDRSAAATPSQDPSGSASAVPDGTPTTLPSDDPALGSGPVVEVQLPVVPLADAADYGTQVTATLPSVERVEGMGNGPGERSGAALAITVLLTNGSDEPVDLDYLVVNLYGADGSPGSLLASDPNSAPMSGQLAAGASGSGTYVLRLPAETGDSVRVTVSYGASAPTAVFEGQVPA